MNQTGPKSLKQFHTNTNNVENKLKFEVGASDRLGVSVILKEMMKASLT